MAKKEKKDTGVRVRVTLDLNLGRFWEEDNTLEEIQQRAENMLHNALNDLRYAPKIVGAVSVLLSGGTK
jgi:hypothetical protein